ncbi:MAG: ATP-dependent DNA helicase RecG [Phycisphaerales bacterium]|nr:ATP-dependent DNA helicase RecG [Phycisphaerales bacterium]
MPGAEAITFHTPLAGLKGIGPKAAADLAGLGITRLGHLLAHLPMRHERIEAEAPLRTLKAEQIVAARGEITATRLAGTRGKERLEAVLCDDTGRIDLVWFNGAFLRKSIMPGARLRVQGKTRQRGPGLQLANPQYEILDGDEPPAEARIRPVYPASEAIASRRIERAVGAVLDRALPLIEDHLPEDYRRERALPALRDAYRMIHRPADEREALEARRRLAFDELLLLQLGVHLRRRETRMSRRAPRLACSPAVDAHIRKRLSFALTGAQNTVVAEIARDLARDMPANRLLQGDVGSGKTAVALYAMLLAVAGRHQAALMAPSEILAEQHAATIGDMLRGSRVRVALLTGSTPKADRPGLLKRLRAGEIDILIGTHALLTEDVAFASLALVVVDEQHRFGVHQRARLRAKAEDASSAPHVLVMTATPIPRTLAITLFGDLDVSTITGLPPGRKPVRTRVVPSARRAEVLAWARTRLEAGEQAYIVAPSIDESEDLASVEALHTALGDGPFAGLALGVLHGRLKAADRERVMRRFRAGEVHALVCTTIIEVGVDVPNASIMIVESADRFGLAQLHQLRGRIGRGTRPSVCVLIGDPATPESQARLEAARTISDGFALAERDFELRGPGEVFGARQSGLPPFKVADLMRDRELLALARRDAAAWIERSPGLAAPDEKLLRARLLKTYGEALGLADVG